MSVSLSLSVGAQSTGQRYCIHSLYGNRSMNNNRILNIDKQSTKQNNYVFMNSCCLAARETFTLTNTHRLNRQDSIAQTQKKGATTSPLT